MRLLSVGSLVAGQREARVGVTQGSRTWARRVESGSQSRALVDTGAFRDACRAARMSQLALARRVGCSKAFVGFLCTGERVAATVSLAEAIEDALGVDRGDLFPVAVPAVPART